MYVYLKHVSVCACTHERSQVCVQEEREASIDRATTVFRLVETP